MGRLLRVIEKIASEKINSPATIVSVSNTQGKLILLFISRHAFSPSLKLFLLFSALWNAQIAQLWLNPSRRPYNKNLFKIKYFYKHGNKAILHGPFQKKQHQGSSVWKTSFDHHSPFLITEGGRAPDCLPKTQPTKVQLWCVIYDDGNH